ncbi:hypothetical protein HKX48_008057 [Thoreauomyces humboldtii]|nr:hypothetical protein HKX48_008057 [Thoreauomyces humboldtii]
MASKEEILAWADGVDAYRNQDWNQAIEIFQQVGDYSRIHFNSAMIYSQIDDFNAAITCYTNALGADPFLAVAYFQRAYCAFMQEEYQEAETDYASALMLLRENDFIDYTQLGLKYRLYRCEIHFNRAMCAHSIGDRAACTQDLTSAQRVTRTDEQRAIVDRAARAGVDVITLFTVPLDGVFEAGESKVRNAAGRTYLKDAKVVSGSEGGWAGFEGARILDPDAVGSREGTVMRPRRGTDPGPRPEPERIITTKPSSLGRNASRRATDRDDSRGAPPAPWDSDDGDRRRESPTSSPIRYNTQPRQSPTASPVRSNSVRSNNSYNNDMPDAPQQRKGSNLQIRLPLRDASQKRAYESPGGKSQGTASPASATHWLTSGKTKVKIHSVSPTSSSPRTILLLLPADMMTFRDIIARCREKLGIDYPELEFRDPSDDEGFISVGDDDDLATAVEVMGKWEFWVRQE